MGTDHHCQQEMDIGPRLEHSLNVGTISYISCLLLPHSSPSDTEDAGDDEEEGGDDRDHGLIQDKDGDSWIISLIGTSLASCHLGPG